MKKFKSIICTMMLLASMSAFAQKPIVVELWPNGAPNSNGMTGEQVTEPKSKTLSKNIKPQITVFPSSKPDSKAIIQCPGGGYAYEAGGWEAMAPWMNSMNITYIVLAYRLPNGGHPEVLESDVHQAISLVRQHAKEWNVDPHAVGIMGSSAGGHLVALASNIYTEETRPDFQILLYPVITMDKKETHMGTRTNLLGNNPKKADVERYSMEKQVTEKTPRAFIVTCSDDNAVPPINSIKYYMALIDHHVSATMHLYPTGGHGFGFSDKMIYKSLWTAELEKWLTIF